MTPTPGSPEAVEQGCTCPVGDNCQGAGFILNGERVFWFDADCPLHGTKKEEADD